MKFSSELIPYLLQSVYDWCCDSGLRTMLLVRDGGESTLPQRHVRDGFIVLDISNAAVRDLDFGDEAVSFEASFDGEPFAVVVDNQEIVCIGSPERRIGMVLPVDSDGKMRQRNKPARQEPQRISAKRKKGGPPELKLV